MLPLELCDVAQLEAIEAEHQWNSLVTGRLDHVVNHLIKTVGAVYMLEVHCHNNHLQILSEQVLYDLLHPNDVALLQISRRLRTLLCRVDLSVIVKLL